MKIHEYQAAQIFQSAGIPVAVGRVTDNIEGAQEIVEEIGYPAVLKSQVLVGGRGKAGGIKVVRNNEEMIRNFHQIKNLTIKGYKVEKILIVKAVDIKMEYYVGITIDSARSDVVLLASASGGVDIEEVSKVDPKAIKKFYLQGEQEIDMTRWPEFINNIFDEKEHREAGTEVFKKLIDVFFKYDCSLAEINPLVIDNNRKILAVDAKINFDDNAVFRHEDVRNMQDLSYEDPDELEAKEHGLSFVKLDGDVGCIVNGAGLAMGTMDVVKLSGGKPANFLDVGGSSDPQKVVHALKIILRNKNIKAILINIFGGITRCDDIAEGILDARKWLDMKIPLVIRLVGTNEKKAKELLAKHDIDTFETMRDAVEKVVALAK